MEAPLQDSSGGIAIQLWIARHFSMNNEKDGFKQKQIMHEVTEVLRGIASNGPSFSVKVGSEPAQLQDISNRENHGCIAIHKCPLLDSLDHENVPDGMVPLLV